MDDSKPFSLQFLGVGGAFSLPVTPGDLSSAAMQSNMVITAPSGARMLFDCGTDIRFSAQMCGYDSRSFHAIYISHEHADHVGGLEWLLLNRLFDSSSPRPLLIAEHQLFDRIWTMLQPSLLITVKGRMEFAHYVEQCLMQMAEDGLGFKHPHAVVWEGLNLKLVENIHVQHPTASLKSYGLLIRSSQDVVYISSDTIFDREQIIRIAHEATVLFQDCEMGFKTGTHAYYDDLLTLPAAVRAKMWLYHYSPIEAAQKDVHADGFCGFVHRGQIFEFN